MQLKTTCAIFTCWSAPMSLDVFVRQGSRDILMFVATLGKQSRSNAIWWAGWRTIPTPSFELWPYGGQTQHTWFILGWGIWEHFTSKFWKSYSESSWARLKNPKIQSYISEIFWKTLWRVKQPWNTKLHIMSSHSLILLSDVILARWTSHQQTCEDFEENEKGKGERTLGRRCSLRGLI